MLPKNCATTTSLKHEQLEHIGYGSVCVLFAFTFLFRFTVLNLHLPQYPMSWMRPDVPWMRPTSRIDVHAAVRLEAAGASAAVRLVAAGAGAAVRLGAAGVGAAVRR